MLGMQCEYATPTVLHYLCSASAHHNSHKLQRTQHPPHPATSR